MAALPLSTAVLEVAVERTGEEMLAVVAPADAGGGVVSAIFFSRNFGRSLRHRAILIYLSEGKWVRSGPSLCCENIKVQAPHHNGKQAHGKVQQPKLPHHPSS